MTVQSVEILAERISNITFRYKGVNWSFTKSQIYPHLCVLDFIKDGYRIAWVEGPYGIDGTFSQKSHLNLIKKPQVERCARTKAYSPDTLY